MINEIQITSITHLTTEFSKLGNHYLYRGHARVEWELHSTLERLLGETWNSERARHFERWSMLRFNSKFQLYNKENVTPKSKLAWLALMQHYGVPTRLLDFTESPYVALYFALEGADWTSGSDLAVFAIDYGGIMQASCSILNKRDSRFQELPSTLYEKHDEVFENVIDPCNYDILWVTEPREINTRLDRQAGSFLVCGNRGSRIGDVLKQPEYSSLSHYKFRIPHTECRAVFALLRKMNIDSRGLYGDLSGLAWGIRMELQAYAYEGELITPS